MNPASMQLFQQTKNETDKQQSHISTKHTKGSIQNEMNYYNTLHIIPWRAPFG
jgi:hypothetical protein